MDVPVDVEIAEDEDLVVEPVEAQVEVEPGEAGTPEADPLAADRERCVALVAAFCHEPEFLAERIRDGSDVEASKVLAFDQQIPPRRWCRPGELQ